jgi:hypothetical protein
LIVTQLEDRTVPAMFGTTWVDPNNITFSVVPDGTSVDGAQSTLNATLAATMSQSVWNAQIQQAFQTWVNAAGIDVSQRWDDGAPVGVNTPIQGSSQFGDIRISAVPLSNNVVAIANPPDLVSPWRGEIVLNSNLTFSADGAAGTYQLYTVMLHEIGHTLGLDDDDADPNTAMSAYSAPRTGLAASDIAAVQALYGPHANDAYEGKKGNDTAATATALTYINGLGDLASGDVGPNGQLYIARGELAAGDVDYYRFTQPSNSTSALVSVSAGTVSLLRARVQVYDASGHLLDTFTPSSGTNDVYGLVSNVTPGGNYYVRVDAQPGTPFAVGAYRIGVGSPVATLAQQMSATIANVDGGERTFGLSGTGSDDTIQTAINLGKLKSKTANYSLWDVAAVSQFSTAGEDDVYKISTGPKMPSVMVVAAWSDAGARPTVTVTDAQGNVLSANVLTNSSTSNIIQVTGVTKNTDYYIWIRAAAFGSGTGPKPYHFGVDFTPNAVALPALASGTLTSAAPQMKQTLSVTQSTGFQFSLAPTDTADGAATAARLTVFDASGNALLSLVAQNGQTVSGMLLLPPGTYTVVIVGAASDGSALTGLRVDARLVGVTDPIGPMLADPYGVSPPPPTPAAPVPPRVSPPPPPAPSYAVTSPVSGIGFLAPTSPYSSPY